MSRNSECNDEHHRRLSLVFLSPKRKTIAGTNVSVSGNVPGNVSGGESGPRKVAPRECERDCECKCERV